MKCRYCGKEIADGSTFCEHCGSWLQGRSLWEEWEEFTASEEPAPAVPEQSTPDTVYIAPAEAESASEGYTGEENMPEEYSTEEYAPEEYVPEEYVSGDDVDEATGDPRKWIIPLAVLLVAVLIAAGAIFLVKSRDKAEDPATSPAAEETTTGEVAADEAAAGGAASEEGATGEVAAEEESTGETAAAGAAADEETAGNAAEENDADTDEDSDSGQAEEGVYKDCVFPYSSKKKLSDSDLKDKSAEDLHTGINEIYARHGRIFTSKPYDTMFKDREWYHPKEQTDDQIRAQFNEVENYNVNLLDEAISRLP